MAEKRNSRILVVVLIAIIAVLFLILVYAFVIRPSVNGYIIQQQNAGVAYALNTIVSSVQQNGYVQIPIGNNQTIVLVEYKAQAPQTGTS